MLHERPILDTYITRALPINYTVCNIIQTFRFGLFSRCTDVNVDFPTIKSREPMTLLQGMQIAVGGGWYQNGQ